MSLIAQFDARKIIKLNYDAISNLYGRSENNENGCKSGDFLRAYGEAQISEWNWGEEKRKDSITKEGWKELTILADSMI